MSTSTALFSLIVAFAPLVSAEDVNGCHIIKGQNLYSNDFRKFHNVASVGDCAGHCDDDDRCTHFTWSDNSKGCWLKEGYPTPSYLHSTLQSGVCTGGVFQGDYEIRTSGHCDNGVWSLTENECQAYAAGFGMDFDVVPSQANRPSGCTTKGGKITFFKGANGMCGSDQYACVCGQTYQHTSCAYTWIAGKNYEGPVFREVWNMRSMEHCKAQCSARPDCTHFTYSENSNKCWLRNGIEGEETSGNMAIKSGFKRDTNCNTIQKRVMEDMETEKTARAF